MQVYSLNTGKPRTVQVEKVGASEGQKATLTIGSPSRVELPYAGRVPLVNHSRGVACKAIGGGELLYIYSAPCPGFCDERACVGLTSHQDEAGSSF